MKWITMIASAVLALLSPPLGGSCPEDMVSVEGFCIDRYEAPNRLGDLPLVMFNFNQAEAWCEARNKRLCYDTEWTRACEGPEGNRFPYGKTRQPGVCVDDKAYIPPNGKRMWPWPTEAGDTDVDNLSILLASAAENSLDQVIYLESLYQAEPSGSYSDCRTSEGVYDLAGNAEEWVRRKKGGKPDFHGKLKGRFWSHSFPCRASINHHADAFRYYEVGFRCCKDAVVSP